MASSTKPADDQSKKTLEAVHQSKEVKTRSFFGNISGKPVKQNCDLQVPHTRDQSSRKSPQSRSKRSFCPFGSSSLQSNFFAKSNAESHPGSSNLRLNAKPFDEFAMGPPNIDTQSGTTNKPNGSHGSWTETK